MNPSMQKVTYYIETHLDDELDVIQLAKVAGYSHFHFCRIFKVPVGESAMSYATRLRLERASSELVFGEKSVIEVALDAGYQTPTGFLKAFKTRFGTTPTAYKKSAKTALTYTGSKESEKAWYGLYAWVEEQGHTFRDEPAFEKYIDALEVAPDEITTEVYVPIV